MNQKICNCCAAELTKPKASLTSSAVKNITSVLETTGRYSVTQISSNSLGGEINLAQGFERFHSLTVALERGTERRSVGTTTAQVPSPPERWRLLHSHSSPHSPLAASPIPSCASHISIYKINRLTKEPLSGNKFKYLLQMGRGRKTEH